jgi:hypothetical protein
MITLCCVCGRQKHPFYGWFKPVHEIKGRVSHGYCPKCANKFREEFKKGEKNVVAKA